MSRRARTEAEHSIGLICHVNFDGGELHRQVDEAVGCKESLDDRRDDEPPGEGLKKEIVRSGRGSSASGALL